MCNSEFNGAGYTLLGVNHVRLTYIEINIYMLGNDSYCNFSFVYLCISFIYVIVEVD